MPTDFIVVDDTLKGNASHDPLTGRFTYGAGNRTRDREDTRQASERKEAATDRPERKQASSGVVIQPEMEARRQGQSTNGFLDTRQPSQMQLAAQETGGRRMFTFGQGEGSALDKTVRLVTNTNAQGTFARGTLRVEINSPDSGKKLVRERPMAQLSMLVQQLSGKGYTPISQHRRKQSDVVKAVLERLKAGEGNPHHDSAGKFASGSGSSTKVSFYKPQPMAKAVVMNTDRAYVAVPIGDWGEVEPLSDGEIELLSNLTPEDKTAIMARVGGNLRMLLEAE